MSRQSLFRSKTVELRFYAVAPRAPRNGNLSFRGLRLIRPRVPERTQINPQAQPPPFSAAEMRHSFAIWSLIDKAPSARGLHLYYCLRCRWSFRVDDWRGSVTPLDLNGHSVKGIEAIERLATFGLGPCPAFNHWIENPRLTQQFTAVETIRARLVSLFVLLSAPVQRLVSWMLFGRESERRAPKIIIRRGRGSRLPNRGNQK